VRRLPFVRVRRQPDPWETLAWAITEQLIDLERAVEIQKRLIAAFGPRAAGLRDAPSPATIAARAPAELAACGLAPKRALAMIRVAREVAAGRVVLARAASEAPQRSADLAGDPAFARLLAIPEIGRWTVEMVALHGLGRLDVVPAGDLGYLKLIGRLTTGRPRAVADEAEVRGFFARYAPWAGLAGSYLRLSGASLRPAPRPAGTRSSAAAPRTAAA
jgi:3-methyladenine DNA glycosylase/8-oxoguanine DNA glycosylase